MPPVAVSDIHDKEDDDDEEDNKKKVLLLFGWLRK